MCEMKREIAKASTKDCTDLPRRWTWGKRGCFVLPSDMSAPRSQQQSHCCHNCFLRQPWYWWHRQPGWSGGTLAIPEKLLLPVLSLCNPLSHPKGLNFESVQSWRVAVEQVRPTGCSGIMLAGTFILTAPKELTLCKRYKLNTEVWLSQGTAWHSEQVTDSPSNFPD